jgi:hypothetical protein
MSQQLVAQRMAESRAKRFALPASIDLCEFDHLVEWLHTKSLPAFVVESVRRDADRHAELVTAMPCSAFDDFDETGIYRTLLTHGPTWHGQFAADPIAAREWNDRRLFGAPAPEVAFAVLGLWTGTNLHKLVPLHGRAAILAYLAKHSEKEGVTYVRWHKRVLERATFCYGDSQQNFFVLPYSPERMAALALLHAIATFHAIHVCPLPEWGMRVLNIMCAQASEKNPYFEIQIHGGVTPDDIEATAE